MEQYYLEFLGMYFLGLLAGGTIILGIYHFFFKSSQDICHSKIENGPATLYYIEDWANLATGRSGWIEIEEAWLRKAQEVYGVFCDKQADYGPTNIGVGGTHGITVRLGDKVSRLFELMGLTERENTGKPANESIRDTMVDIGDYGIIGMIVLDGDWPLVNPTDVWGGASFTDFILQAVKEDNDFYEELIIRLSEWRVAEVIAKDLGGEVIDA
jgi:hypothetical protein